MKKRILMFVVAVICAFSIISCGTETKVDPAKTDSGVYDVSKLYSAGGLNLSQAVKELKEENGAWIVKTEMDIVSGTTMSLEVTFKDDKFNDVKMTIVGTDKEKYESAIEEELDTTPAPSEEVPQPEASSVTKSNDPTAVKGQNIRMPREGRGGENNKASNPFDFDTVPAQGTATDHQTVGTAAFESLEYAVGAYRFIRAAKNVFGSYANYLEATQKSLSASWEFGRTLVTESAASATVKIDKVLEFPLSYIIFASSSAPLERAQSIQVMVRIDKNTNKVLKADYAYFHVSEYYNNAAAYIKSLEDAKEAVIGVETTKVFSGKKITEGETSFELDGVTGATIVNSVLVNAFNAAFDYYHNYLMPVIAQ